MPENTPPEPTKCRECGRFGPGHSSRQSREHPLHSGSLKYMVPRPDNFRKLYADSGDSQFATGGIITEMAAK